MTTVIVAGANLFEIEQLKQYARKKNLPVKDVVQEFCQSRLRKQDDGDKPKLEDLPG